MDYLYWLFGDVERVHASTCNISSLKTDINDDFANITLEFKSGIIGQVHLDYIQRPPVHTLTVLGENGRAKWDYYADTLHWEFVNGDIHTEQSPVGFDRNTMFINEIKHFLECIEQRKPTCIPLDDGIAVLDIAIRAKQNALEGIKHA